MNNIRYIRQRALMTQEDLAKKAGLGGGASVLSRYERGKKKMTVLTAFKIANALGVSLDDLMGVQPYEES